MVASRRSDAAALGTFDAGRRAWLQRIDTLRNMVRQEMVTRQLTRHMKPAPGTVLDIGAGQGTQALRLATAGYEVTALEPDPAMRRVFLSQLHVLPEEVQHRIHLSDEALGSVENAVGASVFDAVLVHGVLMYLPESGPALTEAAGRVAAGGILAVAVRDEVSTLWEPVARHNWTAALAAFDEWDAAHREHRDVRYVNEVGSPARADRIDALTRHAQTQGLQLERWYGLRVATESADLDAPPPEDPAELTRLFEVEERLTAIDPYRQLSQLAHLIFRRDPQP